MGVALCALSHAPLYGISDPEPQTTDQIHCAFDDMRAFITNYDPELTIVFGPDHYNGVFYDMMPPFCVGARASSVGDWGTETRPLPVDRTAARALLTSVLNHGIDIAQSEEMFVDHGISQPLELLFGKGYVNPIIPVFINAVGLPLVPMQRIRLLGEAVGRHAIETGKRILVIGSGGLSHDPPVPRLEEAPPEVVQRLIDGRDTTPEVRAAREKRIVEFGKSFAVGEAEAQDINPAFDALILRTLAGGDLTAVDGWTNSWFEEEGGHAAHEIRTWVAAYSALDQAGPYRVTASHYWPVSEWGTGFAMTTAISV